MITGKTQIEAARALIYRAPTTRLAAKAPPAAPSPTEVQTAQIKRAARKELIQEQLQRYRKEGRSLRFDLVSQIIGTE